MPDSGMSAATCTSGARAAFLWPLLARPEPAELSEVRSLSDGKPTLREPQATSSMYEYTALILPPAPGVERAGQADQRHRRHHQIGETAGRGVDQAGGGGRRRRDHA